MDPLIHPKLFLADSPTEQPSKLISPLGMRELCWNNFRNNDGVKESRIIPEF